MCYTNALASLASPLRDALQMPLPDKGQKGDSQKGCTPEKRTHRFFVFVFSRGAYRPRSRRSDGAARRRKVIHSFARRGKGKGAPCRSEGLRACMGEREGEGMTPRILINSFARRAKREKQPRRTAFQIASGQVMTCTERAGGSSPTHFTASNIQPQKAAGRPANHVLIRRPL